MTRIKGYLIVTSLLTFDEIPNRESPYSKVKETPLFSP